MRTVTAYLRTSSTALRARPGFAIQNPITQFDPLDPSRVAFNKPRVCGRADPAGRWPVRDTRAMAASILGMR